MENQQFVLFLTLKVLILSFCSATEQNYISAVGDPGMRRDGLRVAFEGWNFCNEVGSEAPGMGSPRAADCFDFSYSALKHKVTDDENRLGVGKPFPGLSPEALNNPDLYAAEKESYLGSLCEVPDTPQPWQFWMVMLKNGNFDTKSGLCPENGKKVGPFPPTGRFPCFGNGCMNQPLLYHEQTLLLADGKMRGGFKGSYDLGGDVRGGGDNISYFEVIWEKTVGVGSWVFSHKLRTTENYPWLMLYLRADATRGFSGGYHYQTRGMLKTISTLKNHPINLYWGNWVLLEIVENAMMDNLAVSRLPFTGGVINFQGRNINYLVSGNHSLFSARVQRGYKLVVKFVV